jgi:hypothetical protein
VSTDLLDQMLTILFVSAYAGKHLHRRLEDDAHQTDLDALLNIVRLIDRKHIDPDPERLLGVMQPRLPQCQPAVVTNVEPLVRDPHVPFLAGVSPRVRNGDVGRRVAQGVS